MNTITDFFGNAKNEMNRWGENSNCLIYYMRAKMIFLLCPNLQNPHKSQQGN